MFVELLLGIGLGSIIGGAARIFIIEGGVWNPRSNLGPNILDAIEKEASERGSSIMFNSDNDSIPL
jgi:hypothetical protein